MGLLDAIDKLLEPITKKIFATEIGKNIGPLAGEELFTDGPDYTGDLSYAFLPDNIGHQSWVDQHESHCLEEDE
ncbi:MAG: hypothetical protein J0665_10125 [Deltaproteobacteria bacterium]|nr:hypothetical protein [Deltaproteobacteria bacterium]